MQYTNMLKTWRNNTWSRQKEFSIQHSSFISWNPAVKLDLGEMCKLRFYFLSAVNTWLHIFINTDSIFWRNMCCVFICCLFILIPPANKAWGVYRNHIVRPSVRPSVHPSMYLVSATGLLDCYETLHICCTLPAVVHEGLWLLSKIEKGS